MINVNNAKIIKAIVLSVLILIIEKIYLLVCVLVIFLKMNKTNVNNANIHVKSVKILKINAQYVKDKIDYLFKKIVDARMVFSIIKVNV